MQDLMQTADSGWNRLGRYLFIFVLLGYPLIAIILTTLGIAGQSNYITIAYRAITLVLSLYIIFGAALGLLKGRTDWLFVLFLAAYACRLLYDWQFANVVGADYSLFFFLVVVVLPTVAVMASRGSDVGDLKATYLILLVGNTICIIAYLAFKLGLGFNPWREQGVSIARLGFRTLNSITLAYVGGTVLIAGVYLLVDLKKGILRRIVPLASAALGLVMLLLSNSRGPILATAIALIWFFASNFRRAKYLFPFLIIITISLSFSSDLIAPVIERFSGVSVSAISQGSTGIRLSIQALAIEAFLENPLFGAHYVDPGLGVGYSPHNLFLETAMALGLSGLVLLAVLLFRTWIKIRRFYNREHPLLVMLLVQQFVAVQFSGTLWASSSFLLLFGICLVTKQNKNTSQ